MSDEFIYDEEEGTPPRRNNFLLAVGVLVLIGVLAMVCSFGVLFSRRSAVNPQATAIAATNAVRMMTNEAVTVAVEATNLAQLQPTSTPELATEEPTEEPTAVSDTATPTATSILEAVEETTTPAEETESVVGTADPPTETEDGNNDNDADNDSSDEADDTDTNSSGGVNELTPTPISSNATVDSEDALPNTGFNSWGIILAGLILSGVVIAARRLRTS